MSRDHDDALAASFPPSDPPAMTAATADTPRGAAETSGTHASTVDLFRVVPRRDSKAPFSGRRNRSGGRWTSPGVPAVYASRSPAGAVLEFLAHLDGEKPVDLTLVSAVLPAGCLLVAEPLPGHWRDPPPYRPDVQAFGDAPWHCRCRVSFATR